MRERSPSRPNLADSTYQPTPRTVPGCWLAIQFDRRSLTSTISHLPFSARRTANGDAGGPRPRSTRLVLGADHFQSEERTSLTRRATDHELRRLDHVVGPRTGPNPTSGVEDGTEFDQAGTVVNRSERRGVATTHQGGLGSEVEQHGTQ